MDDDGFGTIKTVVTDPEKVAYAMGAYVVYKVRTETTSASFENPEFTVIRRYSDFLWLHEQLQSRYPGVIIPPVPEKQTLGRFQEEFVESRRCALEQFLQRVVGHRRLRMDEALRGFLASETFAADRKKLEMRTVLNPIPTAETLNAADIRQMDEDLQRRKDHIDELEQQLKTLLRAIEEWQRQQLELSQATHVMGEHIHALSTVDVKLPISRKLAILADAHHNIKTLQERQGKQSISAFMTTADFYLRAIASVNVAFSARLKAYHAWQQTEQVLQRKREALEKVQSKSIRTDKIALVTAEVQEAEASATAATNEYIYVSQGLQSELGRFHMEIVNDFISSMRTMVMSFAEAQRQVTGFWEACMYID
ncbi:Vps5 C terminal like-domain-containing protein [Gaertneriomyces semiglobifer]|nr:Vps5 C terminal like-domain-containing protein [Gaertneriomyces semiglobifer]